MSVFSILANLFGGADAGSTLSPIELKELLAGPGKPVLIDVRTAREVKGGRIPGSRHIDITDAGFSRKADALPREGAYVLYCLSGGRSGRALSAMKGMGFRDVRHLGGGIGSWKAAGYPLAK